MNKHKKKFSWGQLILNIFFILTSITYVLPMLLVISISFSFEQSIRDFGYRFIPSVWSTEAYRLIFKNPAQIIDSYKTTIIFSFVGTALAVLVTALLAYPLSRPSYKLKRPLTWYIFVTMLFSGGLVPQYIINSKYLHLDNTMWIYILPGVVSAWNVIVIRTFFQGLPIEMTESAKIDGAREIVIFFRIIFPLSTPVLASIGFMTLVAKWNDWNTALIYITDTRLYSLQYMLQRILNEIEFVRQAVESGKSVGESANVIPTENVRYAMAMLAAGPMLIVFPFFQKYFAKGMTVGAVKG